MTETHRQPAPNRSTYIIEGAPDPFLPNSRVLTAGANVTIVDGGPGGTLTISSSGGGGGTPGPQGPVVWQEPELGEDPAPPIPGPIGPQGNPGAQGPPGPTGPAFWQEPELGEDPVAIPGPAGAAGMQGLPGVMVWQEPELGEDNITLVQQVASVVPPSWSRTFAMMGA